MSTIIDELSKPKTLDQIVAGLLEEQERYIKEHSILNVLLREQRQVETTIENVMAAIERGVITNTTTKRLKELEARQEELDRQILIERSKNGEFRYRDMDRVKRAVQRILRAQSGTWKHL